MTRQVKRLKALSLIVVVALVITLAPPLSVIGEEVITLTTIMPSQDTLRVKRGAVGLTYRQTATLSNEEIGGDNLLIEGNVGIGTTSPGAKLDSQGMIRALNTAHVSPSEGEGLELEFRSDGNAYILSYDRTNHNFEPLLLYASDIGLMYGKVGIGTTSPGEKLTVAGTIESTTGGVKFPDGTVQTTAAGAAGYGAWATKSYGTLYTAATDGIVVAIGYNNVGYIILRGYTDGTQVVATSEKTTPNDVSITFPVRKGDTWQVTFSKNITASCTVRWLPTGS